MRRTLIEVVARWCAGASDWHPLAANEIVLERTGTKWHVTYLVHGERHAYVGFDDESEARRDIEYLMTRCPLGMLPWCEVGSADARGAS
jgi:hypothetical protein